MKTSIRSLILTLSGLLLPASAAGQAGTTPQLASIPAGEFEMGDHHGFVDPKHGGDEVPVHKVRVDAFRIGIHPVTTARYCAFLNSALGRGSIEVRDGGAFLAGGRDLLCETRIMSQHSRIGWDGKRFDVLDEKQDHPVVRGGVLAQGGIPGKDMRGHLWNAVFKVHRYGPDYPGLAGRDLIPGEPIEANPTPGLESSDEQPRTGGRPGGGRGRPERQTRNRQGGGR